MKVGGDLMSKDKKEKKRKKRMKKVIAYIIAAILIIAFNVLYLSRYFLGVYINYKRNDWETDRNFYGKECSVDQLKVTKNGYEKYECNVKNITKKKELGKIKYDYADNVTQFELTAAEYEKYAKGVDVFYIYTPECELKYKSNNGILTAAFSGKEEYLYPHRFTENEMEGFKNVVIETVKIRYLQHMLLKLLLELVKHLRVCQNIRTKKDEN